LAQVCCACGSPAFRVRRRARTSPREDLGCTGSMAAQEGASYTDVAKKADQVGAELEEEDEILAVMEADLHAAEARVEAAELRYRKARRAIERELAQEAEASVAGAGVTAGVAAKEDIPELQADKEPTHLGSHTAKNASARTDKEVSHERWVAARAAEGRVRDRATKARQRLRRNARDRKFQWAEPVPVDMGAEVETKAAPAEEPKAPAPKPAPAADTPAAKEGAQGLAERLNCIKERPNAAEKHSAVLRVVTGGKDNYFTFEPADVLKDLKARGILEAATADEFLALLASPPATKPAEVPAEGWAAGAQKASAIERLDDKPFKDEEIGYLKCVEEKALMDAEAELAAAEAQLGKLVAQAVTRFGELDADEGDAGNQAPELAGDVRVDEDEADRLEASVDPSSHRESKGSKNTSALNPKVVSKEKWEKAHSKEARDREHESKARDARRAEARDIKQGAADV